MHSTPASRAARTPEGLRAKVTVLEASLMVGMLPDGEFSDNHEALAWSPVQDMLGTAS